MRHLDESELINFLKDSMINKSEVASILYQSEIANNKITREAARKRLQTKLNESVSFSDHELAQLGDICYELREKLGAVKFEHPNISEGYYATDGKMDFRIVHFNIFNEIKVMNLQGELLTVEFDNVKSLFLSDKWIKWFGLKIGSVLKKDTNREWKLKKLGRYYYIAGEFSNGNENPVISLHTVDELQRWYKRIVGSELFIRMNLLD